MIYRYRATIVSIHDGDTLTVDLDMGRHIWSRGVKHRIKGINARELKDPGGLEAKANLQALLPVGLVVDFDSLNPYKYGDEYMCDITLTLPTGLLGIPGRGWLSAHLIATHWAAQWNGTGNRANYVPPWPRPEDTTEDTTPTAAGQTP
jgi:hypothetical protein